jgi:hypothetical protein
MSWCSFEDVPNKEEIQSDAQRLNASWTCIRVNDTVIQGGFCSPVGDDKYPTKLYSLAAMLADSREQPWLGIFKIEEGVWWYIAVRDGNAILPDGDIVGGEEEIRTAQERHSGYQDWKYFEGDLDFLSEFLAGIKAKPTPVRSLTRRKLPATQIIASLLTLSIITGSGYMWMDHKKQVAEKERADAMAKAKAAMLAGQAPVVLPSPLLTTPEPNDWLFACRSIILDLPLSQNGWSFSQVECNTESVIVHWIRQNGATVANMPEGVLGQEGNNVEQTIPLPGFNKNGINDALDLPAEKVLLRAWAQTAGFTLSLNEAAPALLLPGATAVPAVSAQASQTNFKLEVTVSPLNLDMSIIPGLRLTKISSAGTGWNIEGMLYGR